MILAPVNLGWTIWTDAVRGWRAARRTTQDTYARLKLQLKTIGYTLSTNLLLGWRA